MRRKIIVANWKMNKTPKEALELIGVLKDKINVTDKDVVLCVPYIDLIPVIEALKGTNIKIGAQNMHFEESGAYTGEISAGMLKEIGVEYVIVGHSERRKFFEEKNVNINKKVLKAFEHDLIPIVCVGEMARQREQGITIDFIRIQVKTALQNVPIDKAKKLVMAYEPIWAIGTGKTATREQAEEVCSAIRQVIRELYDDETAESVRVQYGGSVKGSNAADLFSMQDVDGGLVGGASLEEDFANVVNY